MLAKSLFRLVVLGALSCGLGLGGSAACSGSQKTGAEAGTQPGWQGTSQQRERQPAQTQRLLFAPAGAAATRYNEPNNAEPVSSAVGAAIIHQISVLSAELGKPVPVPDGRLHAASRDLAAITPDQGTVAYRMVEFALQRHGIIEPSPHLVVMRAVEGEHDAVLEELGNRLGTILAESDFARVGIGTFKRSSGESVIVLALQTSAIETDPIPRAVKGQGTAVLSGRILPPYTEPHVYVTRPNGGVETLSATVGENGAFRSELSCAGHRGKQQVEVTASDHTGSTVLANFPLWCGQEPPSSITVDVGGDGADQFANASEAEGRMVKLINRDRASHGLPPLLALGSVAAVSRGHSLDMLKTGIVGHVSPNTGTASDRVSAATIRTAVVLENVARAYGLNEAQDGLMNSPGHRANILSRTATHVGIGIVLGKEVADRREMFITQVFIRIPPVIDKATFTGKVAERIQAVRPLRVDPKLGDIAQTFADEIAAGGDLKAAAGRASDTLHKTQMSYRGVTTLATTVADISSFDADAAVGETSVTHFGIGVGQGDHPEIGKQAIFIVVLFGHN